MPIAPQNFQCLYVFIDTQSFPCSDIALNPVHRAGAALDFLVLAHSEFLLLLLNFLRQESLISMILTEDERKRLSNHFKNRKKLKDCALVHCPQKL